MPVEELAAGVHLIRLGPVNSYLVRGASGAVLVDTGLPGHAAALVGILGELGLLPGGLTAVLLTHRHLDHAGGAAALRARCGVEVLVHEADAAAVAGHDRLSPGGPGLGRLAEPLAALLDQRVFRYRPCEATAIRGGWRGHGLTLVHLPGHTPGHCGFFHQRTGVVFAGDAAMNRRGRVSGPSGLFTVDREAARRSLTRLAELDGALYCFGHGRPLPRGAAAISALASRDR